MDQSKQSKINMSDYLNHTINGLKIVKDFAVTQTQSAVSAVNALNSSNMTRLGLEKLAKEEILNIGNSLTGILSDRQIKLDPPQFVVVGTQSSGKSSLLNRIIGMDILPTGKMMVTRTPMNLQMIKSDDKKAAEFGDYVDGNWKLDKRIALSDQPTATEIATICDEIEQQTLRKAGQQKGISHNSIILKIYAPYLPNLSLIDLPGLTSVACIDKGQPEDIKKQIRNMVGSYIESSRSIILLVMPARTDLEVDQAFDLVKEYDPRGERTIGVITKVDLMNDRTDISNYLENEHISQSLQLKYGYFAVKNKGPHESDLTCQRVIDSEKNYFRAHSVYARSSAQDRMGINNLVLTLSNVLIHHIKESIPELLSEIYKIDNALNLELRKLGSSLPTKEADQASLIHSLIAKFCKKYVNALEDRGSEFNYGRQVKDIFVKYRTSVYSAKYDFTNKMISEAITNCDGNHMLSLPSIEVLEYCLKKQQSNQNSPGGPIGSLEPLSKNCSNLIKDLLISLMNVLLKDEEIMRFPHLVSQIKREITTNIIYPQKELINSQIDDLVKIEENYIWTDEEDFKEELKKLYQNIKPGQIDNSVFRNLINSYFTTVKKNMADRVPKMIMYYLVTNTENAIYSTLFERIIQKKTLSELLEESPNISEKRKRLEKQKAQIDAAKALLENAGDK